MKKHIFKGALAAVAAMGILASCGHDYLQLEPATSISAAEAMATTQAARMATRSLARAMYTQYYDMAYPKQCSGEGTLNAIVNDALGPDDASYFHMRQLGTNWYPWRSMANPISSFCEGAWTYCYNFVGQANTIIDNIANAEGDEAERQLIEAVARTYRAHGYIKALQWFGPRWQDSEGGTKAATVLRKTSGTGPAPLGSLAEVLDFIYEDLETAERLFAASGLPREGSYEPDIYVAYGLHARAALIKNDWKTAREKAHRARQGREVMTMEQYFEGFISENDEYMWTNFGNDVLYYYSPGSWFACNGQYPTSWGRCLGINIDLYDRLDPADERRKLYFMPSLIDDVAAIDGYESVATLKRDDFWNADFIDPAGVNVKNLKPPAAAVDSRMLLMAQGFIRLACANNPNSSSPSMVNYPYSYRKSEWPGGLSVGAAVKMWSDGTYGDSAYPYMRAAEMYLTEAEAAYMDGDMATAKECLTAVNSKRIADYQCTSSGEGLLEEIRLCRRIELWGEGHNFPDFKRWNVGFTKRKFTAGDPASGNVDATYAFTVDTSSANGWRLAIPQQEIDSNSGIDRTLVNK
ncbi:MAG: RagB/SusD family nutrient uptake outer membrane protein [Muribaculaceae bacterium]|nr:RagB/SusD family nutrient uptake outer membrane protein [Muribaculaceae bacterium]